MQQFVEPEMGFEMDHWDTARDNEQKMVANASLQRPILYADVLVGNIFMKCVRKFF